MNLEDLNKINREQIQRAGARYTPGLDPEAPNVEVPDLPLAFAALGWQETIRAHIRELEGKVRHAIRLPPKAIKRIFLRRKFTPEKLADDLQRLAESNTGEHEQHLRGLSRCLGHVQRKLNLLEDALYNQEQALEEDEARQKLRMELHDVRQVMTPIREVAQFLDAPSSSLLANNAMLLLGDWGTGKTHSLCDLVEQRMEEGLPTLLFLAQGLPHQREPLQGLCDATGLAATPTELLQDLQRLGEETGSRSLVVIDAINEGNREQWKRKMASIVQATRQFPNVGILLSCRRPFDQLIFTERSRRNFVTVEHRGFVDVEIDAHVEFFTYYEIPVPHVPLLTPEFSRPLFLRLLCQSIRNRSVRSKSDYVRDIASGQKGMTRVLEDFVKEVGRPIEVTFGLPGLTCWRLLKGRTPAAGVAAIGIAPTMANNLQKYIMRDECVALIDSFTGWGSPEKCEEFLQRLLADGLLIESVRWAEEGPVPVVQFSFERFGDHLIARNLLQRHLRLSSVSAMKRSFYVNQPLGQIFEVDSFGSSYKMPGLASAIMLEFPERVKRLLPSEERELVNYLPKNRRLAAPLRDVFLEGLYWRASDSFTEQTDHVINFFLNRPHEFTRNAVLEVLVSLATKPGHPYEAARLYRSLAAQTLPERDLVWSEFLRSIDNTSAVFRLLDWVERTEGKPRDSAVVENCVTLLSLCLTTTRRVLRDRVTRALYLLGLSQPKTLFRSTVVSLDFSDPYVPERMLAAAYGVAMSMWADPRGKAVQTALPALASELVKRMFALKGKSRTTHALMQDYALGVIELARRVAPRCIPTRDLPYLRKPLKSIRSRFPAIKNISDAVEDVKSVLHMDFKNYTLGRLVKGRGNYDFKHQDYQTVRRRILWRLASLGYTEEEFATIDGSIARGNRDRDASRVDRYGKKYSWIAFYEMYGVRRMAANLSEWNDDRPSDVDIDPSFPPAPRRWEPPISGILDTAPLEPLGWLGCGLAPDHEGLLRRNAVDGVQGPWILIEGYIEESPNQGAARDDKRRIFSFLWARFVAGSLVEDLLGLYLAGDYPGNFMIPGPTSDHYTYAGEIPWSDRFGSSLHSASGDAVSHVENAFPAYDNAGPQAGIPVEVPSCVWAWESYHSAMNQVGGLHFLAPALSAGLDLVNHSRETDLFDQGGVRATIYVDTKSEDIGLDCHLLFIREDLLNRYLANCGKELVWFVWGERDMQVDTFETRSDEWSDIYQRYENIHKQAYVWNQERCEVVVRS